MQSLELLSPARDAATGRIAVKAGADAVYIGGPSFGARAAAGNSIGDIAELAAFAHLFGARVYVTMNTILFDNEIEEARQMVWQLYGAGVDAIIVQDMAYLEMDLPPIALHASTQCDIRTPEKARLLALAGFSQLVLPREFTLEQISEARQAAGVPVEVFVHGALCVSYSGDCQAGYAAMGRSANRGVCPQMCRLPYRLTDAEGNILAPERHYLSLRDMRQIENLEALAMAGASSFKIEGRLKDSRYVANVTAAYSQALDAIVAAHPDRFCRASAGKSTCNFTPDLDRTFNRGYTQYFLSAGSCKPGRMASLATPKWAGVEVGRVEKPYDRRSGSFTIAGSDAVFANGDGLGFFDASGKFCGFRVNKAEGRRLYPAQSLEGLAKGTVLYRNSDKAFFDRLDRAETECRRSLEIEMTLEAVDRNRISLTVSDCMGNSAAAISDCTDDEARSDQHETRRRNLAKLGDTIYTLAKLDDRLGKRFVPASVLSELRRKTIEGLSASASARYSRDQRRPCRLDSDAFAAQPPLDYHDNVANKLAMHFYTSHGATIAQQAIETTQKPTGELTVMNTRYCIRRELGACLREDGASKLPSPLFLRNDSGVYRLDFDCARCGMSVVRIPGKNTSVQ